MLDLSQRDIVEGSIPRALLILATPLVVQNLVHVVNQLVDTFWVGRLGEAELAALGLNFPIIALLFAVVIPAGVGTHIVVSQRVGAGERAAARKVAYNGALLALALGALVAVPVRFGAEAVVAPLAGGDARVASLAALYLGTLVLFWPFAGASDAVENAFVASGDTRAALYINLLMVGTNVVLDPFLIFGWGPFPALGVQGAALATGVSYAVGLGAGLTLATGLRESFRLTRESSRLDPATHRELLDVGAPIGAQRAVGQTVRVLVVGLVAVAGGAAGLAAYTVGARVASVAFIPAAGFQQAAQSMIGQNLGAEKPERADRTVWTGVGLVVAIFAVLGACQRLVPEAIALLVAPELTAAGFDLSVYYLVVLAYGYWGIGATYVFLAGFNGARRTRTSLLVDVAKYWGIRLPVALLAVPAGASFALFGLSVAPGMGWGVEAVFWGVTASNVVAALGVGAYYAYTTRGGMFEQAAEKAAATAGD